MGFAAIRDQQRRISASQIEEKPEPQYEKPKQHIEYQIQAPVQTFDENRKPNAENGKSTERNEQQNRKTDVFWHRNQKPDLKKGQNRKPQCHPLEKLI